MGGGVKFRCLTRGCQRAVAVVSKISSLPSFLNLNEKQKRLVSDFRYDDNRSINTPVLYVFVRDLVPYHIICPLRHFGIQSSTGSFAATECFTKPPAPQDNNGACVKHPTPCTERAGLVSNRKKQRRCHT